MTSSAKPYLNLLHGDCLDQLKHLQNESVHAVVTDPPYHLTSCRGGKTGFRGETWDGGDIAMRTDVWAECLRVLKPGGHLIAFTGARTYHRIASAIEDAGFDIRDQIMWLFGTGFPKNHDIAKAIDKANGIWRGRAGQAKPSDQKRSFGQHYSRRDKGHPVTKSAKEWQGWGTALKPAHEPICLARKPLTKGTLADNVVAHQTGAMNLDACRIGNDSLPQRIEGTSAIFHRRSKSVTPARIGRWPANVMHDGSDVVVDHLPVMSGKSVARYFYCGKALKADRDEGLAANSNHPTNNHPTNNHPTNNHPTVKPTTLMRYLCRLITPVGGIVLDPFMGSGSTGKAARREGFGFIGIERQADYFAIASARITATRRGK